VRRTDTKESVEENEGKADETIWAGIYRRSQCPGKEWRSWQTNSRRSKRRELSLQNGVVERSPAKVKVPIVRRSGE